MFYIVYKTTNLINGKFYVGQHNTSANDGYLGSGKNILRAIRKYGKENFVRETLEYCTSNDVNEKEIFWIKKLNSVNNKVGYNLHKGGTGGNVVDWTKEKRIQHSEKMIGRKHSEETKKKMSKVKIGKNNSFYGKQHSKETIDIIKKLVVERGGHLGQNNPMFGKNHSMESKNKISLKRQEYNKIHKNDISKYKYIFEKDNILLEVFNLKIFCNNNDNEFNLSGLMGAFKKKNKYYKGWKILKILREK